MLVGCAKNKPSFARIEGSEPQRLSFGKPKVVQQVFVAKMKECWLAPPAGILAGSPYDLQPALTNTANGTLPLEQITIDKDGAAFSIEFHSFNDNTLISTRNRGLPQELAVRLKRDVESWILERPGCEAAAPAEPLLSAAPVPAPATQAARSRRGG